VQTAIQTTINETPSSQERNLAILAHASILITFILGVTTSGIGTLAAMLIPFFIWLIYRDRSSYVANHALQATLFQLGSFVALLVVSSIVGAILGLVWLITIVLSFILVGLILLPIAVILSVVGAIILIAVPLASLAYGLTAAWNVYTIGEFRYQWIADWLDRRL